MDPVESPAGERAEDDRPGPASLDQLFPPAYAELRRMARIQLRHEREDPAALNTTSLVHEAYLRLAEQTRIGWNDQRHLLALAAQAMRRVLVDHARRHRARKRGGDLRQVSLAEDALVAETRADTLLALDEALERLEALDPRLCRVVECRFFRGLSEAETADVLQVTTRTVQRDWVKAKAWLFRELVV